MNPSIIKPFMEGVKFARKIGLQEADVIKIQIAVNMLVDEEPTENVSKWTGFDIGYVKYLSEELRYFYAAWCEDQENDIEKD